MTVFAYRAVDSMGKELTGTLSAENRSLAIGQVRGKGLEPVTVEAAGPRGRAGRSIAGERRPRVSRGNVDAFTRELANLLGAGVDLSRALQIISREASRPGAQQCWSDIRREVVGGSSLADALARWPRAFPPVYVAMVRAGETGGFLDVVLGQIADFRTLEQDLTGRVKAALVYPVVLAVLAAGVLSFLLVYFIPRFSGIFAEFGGSLPWLTRAIVRASELMTDHGLMVLLAVAIVAVGLQRLRASESGRRFWERAMLGTPMLGSVVARFALVRFCRMLGTLVGAGVPLVSALRVAREAIGNQTLADTVDHAIAEVQRGSPLAQSLSGSPDLFPASVTEMVAVAEESGRLDTELVRLSTSYETDLDRRLRMLVSLAEPALLMVMASLIGTVVIGMLLPVFTIQELIR